MADPPTAAAASSTTATTAASASASVGYSLVGSYETVQVLSPTTINDVVYCTIKTHPSGVIASLPINKTLFDAGQSGVELRAFAQAIEQTMNDPRVIAAAGSQSIDDSGLLADNVTFTVQYVDPVHAPNGATALATVPVYALNFSNLSSAGAQEGTVNTTIDGVYANLKAAAGG